MKYKSKYPKIIVDTNKSTHFNNALNHNITVEEFYDLMHHTHSLSDLIGNSGEIVDGDIQVTVLNLVSTVNELKQTIETQQSVITELTEKTKTQEETINRLSQQVDNIVEDDSNYIDWDLEKEGIQDLDGNTIG